MAINNKWDVLNINSTCSWAANFQLFSSKCWLGIFKIDILTYFSLKIETEKLDKLLTF